MTAENPTIETMLIATSRLQVNLLSCGPADGEPVILIHGNVSAAPFWGDTMQALGHRYRVLAPDLRGYGATEALPIDATRGLRDWSDDLHALIGALDLGAVHLVGWSMGAGVTMQYTIDHPSTVRSLTLISPLSPYGFGGTRGLDGTPVYSDFAGSGGGTVNAEFLERLRNGDRSDDSPLAPLGTMNAFYFKPPFRAPRRARSRVPRRDALYPHRR